jgi:hypothetical protein
MAAAAAATASSGRYSSFRRFDPETLPFTPFGEKTLLAISTGLGGPRTSMYIYDYIKTHIDKYDDMRVSAYGNDTYKSSDSSESSTLSYETTTRNVINSIKSYAIKKGKDVSAIAFSINLPSTQSEINKYTELERSFARELQKHGQTYKFYRDVDFEWAEEEKKFIEGFRDTLKEYLTNADISPNPKILIDHNAWMHASGRHPDFSNLNFEFMPWLPKILAELEADDKIFLLKKTGPRGSLVGEVPFFSTEAVQKMRVDGGRRKTRRQHKRRQQSRRNRF